MRGCGGMQWHAMGGSSSAPTTPQPLSKPQGSTVAPEGSLVPVSPCGHSGARGSMTHPDTAFPVIIPIASAL